MAGIVITAIAMTITDLRAAEKKLRDSIYICFSLLLWKQYIRYINMIQIENPASKSQFI